jgi:hypothetical protein
MSDNGNSNPTVIRTSRGLTKGARTRSSKSVNGLSEC